MKLFLMALALFLMLALADVANAQCVGGQGGCVGSAPVVRSAGCVGSAGDCVGRSGSCVGSAGAVVKVQVVAANCVGSRPAAGCSGGTAGVFALAGIVQKLADRVRERREERRTVVVLAAPAASCPVPALPMKEKK